MNLLAAIVVVTNLGYVAAFDTSTRCPAWVQYDLEPGEVVAAKRAPFDFTADPRIPESDNAADYSRSGYDRGHLAPAADFNWNTNALRETYHFSNIVPQLPSVNRGLWAEIEKGVRNLATSGTVHVLTFPDYDGDEQKVGRVQVPAHLWKIAWGSFGVRLFRVPNFTAERNVKPPHVAATLIQERTDTDEDPR